MIRRLFSFADFEGEEGCQMATRGRKPTPTAIKELEGNPGKRKINEAEPKPEKKAPPCPKWLEPEAKKEWRRLSKQLEQIGVLTEVDQAAFASYCQAYARWKEAEAAGAAGLHCADLPENHEQDRGAVRPDAVLQIQDHCRCR